MDTLETLLAIEALKRLKARYCRLVDAKDWPAFTGLFAPQAVLVPSGSTGQADPIQGAGAIAAWVAGKLDGAVSIHQAFLPEIDLHAADSASATWAMEDRVEWQDRSLHGFGHYHEHYVLTASGWLIQSTKLVRTRCILQTRS
jgi:hypothetical protein